MGVSPTFLPRLALNWSLPDFCLMNSWNYRLPFLAWYLYMCACVSFIHLFIVVLGYCGVGVWNNGPACARQFLYHLSNSTRQHIFFKKTFFSVMEELLLSFLTTARITILAIQSSPFLSPPFVKN
jgi:hypothetical protein